MLVSAPALCFGALMMLAVLGGSAAGASGALIERVYGCVFAALEPGGSLCARELNLAKISLLHCPSDPGSTSANFSHGDPCPWRVR